MVVHLGVRGWQQAFTPVGLSPNTEQVCIPFAGVLAPALFPGQRECSRVPTTVALFVGGVRLILVYAGTAVNQSTGMKALNFDITTLHHRLSMTCDNRLE